MQSSNNLTSYESKSETKDMLSLHSIKEKKIDEARKLIEAGVDFSLRNSEGQSCFYAKTDQEFFERIDTFLPEILNKLESNAFAKAESNNIVKGINSNFPIKTLHNYIKNKDYFGFLAEIEIAKVNVNGKDDNGQCALHLVNDYNDDFIKTLITHGADVSIRDNNGLSVFLPRKGKFKSNAIFNKDTNKSYKKRLESVFTEVVARLERTVYGYSVKKNNSTQKISFNQSQIIAESKEVNYLNAILCFLFNRSENSDISVYEFTKHYLTGSINEDLLNSGPVSYDIWKKLFISILEKNPVNFKELIDQLKNDFSEDHVDTILHAKVKGAALIHYAVQSGNNYAALELLDAGSSIDWDDIYGNTPLHLAVKTKNTKLCEIFLEFKAQVNAQNNLKQTPLHLADHAEIIDLLIQFGADITAQDANYHTPLYNEDDNHFIFKADNIIVSKLKQLDNKINKNISREYGYDFNVKNEIKKFQIVLENVFLDQIVEFYNKNSQQEIELPTTVKRSLQDNIYYHLALRIDLATTMTDEKQREIKIKYLSKVSQSSDKYLLAQVELFTTYYNQNIENYSDLSKRPLDLLSGLHYIIIVANIDPNLANSIIQNLQLNPLILDQKQEWLQQSVQCIRMRELSIVPSTSKLFGEAQYRIHCYYYELYIKAYQNGDYVNTLSFLRNTFYHLYISKLCGYHYAESSFESNLFQDVNPLKNNELRKASDREILLQFEKIPPESPCYADAQRILFEIHYFSIKSYYIYKNFDERLEDIAKAFQYLINACRMQQDKKNYLLQLFGLSINSDKSQIINYASIALMNEYYGNGLKPENISDNLLIDKQIIASSSFVRNEEIYRYISSQEIDKYFAPIKRLAEEKGFLFNNESKINDPERILRVQFSPKSGASFNYSIEIEADKLNNLNNNFICILDNRTKKEVGRISCHEGRLIFNGYSHNVKISINGIINYGLCILENKHAITVLNANFKQSQSFHMTADCNELILGDFNEIKHDKVSLHSTGKLTVKPKIVSHYNTFIKSGSLNIEGSIASHGRLDIDVKNEIESSSNSLIKSDKEMHIKANSLKEIKGQIHSEYSMQIDIKDSIYIPKNGNIHSKAKLKIHSKSLLCMGEVSSDEDAELNVKDKCNFDEGSLFSFKKEAKIHAKTFESGAHISGTYDLCLMSDHIEIKKGAIYFREINGCVAYTVITPTNETVRDVKIHNLKKPKSLERDELTKLKEQILEITSKSSHTRSVKFSIRANETIFKESSKIESDDVFFSGDSLWNAGNIQCNNCTYKLNKSFIHGLAYSHDMAATIKNRKNAEKGPAIECQNINIISGIFVNVLSTISTRNFSLACIAEVSIAGKNTYLNRNKSRILSIDLGIDLPNIKEIQKTINKLRQSKYSEVLSELLTLNTLVNLASVARFIIRRIVPALGKPIDMAWGLLMFIVNIPSLMKHCQNLYEKRKSIEFSDVIPILQMASNITAQSMMLKSNLDYFTQFQMDPIQYQPVNDFNAAAWLALDFMALVAPTTSDQSVSELNIGTIGIYGNNNNRSAYSYNALGSQLSLTNSQNFLRQSQVDTLNISNNSTYQGQQLSQEGGAILTNSIGAKLDEFNQGGKLSAHGGYMDVVTWKQEDKADLTKVNVKVGHHTIAQDVKLNLTDSREQFDKMNNAGHVSANNTTLNGKELKTESGSNTDLNNSALQVKTMDLGGLTQGNNSSVKTDVFNSNGTTIMNNSNFEAKKAHFENGSNTDINKSVVNMGECITDKGSHTQYNGCNVTTGNLQNEGKMESNKSNLATGHIESKKDGTFVLKESVLSVQDGKLEGDTTIEGCSMKIGDTIVNQGNFKSDYSDIQGGEFKSEVGSENKLTATHLETKKLNSDGAMRADQSSIKTDEFHSKGQTVISNGIFEAKKAEFANGGNSVIDKTVANIDECKADKGSHIEFNQSKVNLGDLQNAGNVAANQSDVAMAHIATKKDGSTQFVNCAVDLQDGKLDGHTILNQTTVRVTDKIEFNGNTDAKDSITQAGVITFSESSKNQTDNAVFQAGQLKTSGASFEAKNVLGFVAENVQIDPQTKISGINAQVTVESKNGSAGGDMHVQDLTVKIDNMTSEQASQLAAGTGQYNKMQPTGSLTVVTQQVIDQKDAINRECTVNLVGKQVNVNASVDSKKDLYIGATQGDVTIKNYVPVHASGNLTLDAENKVNAVASSITAGGNATVHGRKGVSLAPVVKQTTTKEHVSFIEVPNEQDRQLLRAICGNDAKLLSDTTVTRTETTVERCVVNSVNGTTTVCSDEGEVKAPAASVTGREGTNVYGKYGTDTSAVNAVNTETKHANISILPIANSISKTNVSYPGNVSSLGDTKVISDLGPVLNNGSVMKAGGTLEVKGVSVNNEHGHMSGKEVDISAIGNVSNMAGVMQAKEFLSIESKSGNIINECEEQKVRGPYGDMNAYTSAQMQGGTGEGHGGVGLVIQAGNQVINDGSIIASIGTNVINGENGVINSARTNSYIKNISEKHHGLGKYTLTIEMDTQVQPAVISSLEGKNIITSSEGYVDSDGTCIMAKGGSEIYGKQGVRFHPIIVQNSTYTYEEKLFGLAKHTRDEINEFDISNVILGNTRIHSDGDFDGSGLIAICPGKFELQVRNAYFSNPILNHSVKDRTQTIGITFPTFSLGASGVANSFPICSDAINYTQSQDAIGLALNTWNTVIDAANMIRNPSSILSSIDPTHVSLSFSQTKSNIYYQTLGHSSIQCGSLDIDVDTLSYDNAIPIYVTGNANIKAKHLIQAGAKLDSSYKTESKGISFDYSLTGGANLNASYSKSSGKSTQYINQEFKVGGKLTVDIGDWELRNANVDANEISGHANRLLQSTKQNTNQSKSMSILVGTNGNFSFNQAMQKYATTEKESGIHANINFLAVDNTYVEREQGYSFKRSFGISGNWNDFMPNSDNAKQISTISVQYSNNNRDYTLRVPILNQKQWQTVQEQVQSVKEKPDFSKKTNDVVILDSDPLPGYLLDKNRDVSELKSTRLERWNTGNADKRDEKAEIRSFLYPGFSSATERLAHTAHIYESDYLFFAEKARKKSNKVWDVVTKNWLYGGQDVTKAINDHDYNILRAEKYGRYAKSLKWIKEAPIVGRLFVIGDGIYQIANSHGRERYKVTFGVIAENTLGVVGDCLTVGLTAETLGTGFVAGVAATTTLEAIGKDAGEKTGGYVYDHKPW